MSKPIVSSIGGGSAKEIALDGLGTFILEVMCGGANVEHASTWVIYRNTSSLGEIKRLAVYDYATATFNLQVDWSSNRNNLRLANTGTNSANIWYVLKKVLTRAS